MSVEVMAWRGVCATESTDISKGIYDYALLKRGAVGTLVQMVQIIPSRRSSRPELEMNRGPVTNQFWDH